MSGLKRKDYEPLPDRVDSFESKAPKGGAGSLNGNGNGNGAGLGKRDTSMKRFPMNSPTSLTKAELMESLLDKNNKSSKNPALYWLFSVLVVLFTRTVC